MRVLLAAVAAVGLQVAAGSDPCFQLQRFGSGFDVAPFAGGGGTPPRLEGGDSVVAEVAYEGPCRSDFEVQLQPHGTRGGLCAVWLSRAAEGGEPCAEGEVQRWAHEVKLALPPSADACQSLLFGFPPGQQYEYYRLAAWPSARFDPTAPAAPGANASAAREPEAGAPERSRQSFGNQQHRAGPSTTLAPGEKRSQPGVSVATATTAAPTCPTCRADTRQ
mmetsp:Transcript_45355/g.144586  ORF Transcript_45355/g.144586 Transcript_45355/m.144586 type:complete len:220 (+) Transcript_45355:68-727(+)